MPVNAWLRGGTDAGQSASPGRWSRAAWLVVLLGAGYSFLAALLRQPGDASRLWFLDPALMAVFVAGLIVRQRRAGPGRPVSSSRRRVALLFVGGSWLTGMLYELSLRTGASGFGGMHPDTTTSFLLAQGYYVPYAVGGWLLARRYGYSAETVFWTGALSSLYELITIGVPAVAGHLSLWLLAPLLGGYYLTVYGYILALPLLFMDESHLWAAAPRPLSRTRRALLGVALGLACWAVFVAWAALF
mgnify:CR=1 FL=1